VVPNGVRGLNNWLTQGLIHGIQRYRRIECIRNSLAGIRTEIWKGSNQKQKLLRIIGYQIKITISQSV